ncbi:MAG: NAD(P)/FAD-dependent oxidoreductase [Pygmaiobacter massiliensis]|nr:NAD(P)/FAD-dependent oxidoreductase [Pygmaiobacter massiliensis]
MQDILIIGAGPAGVSAALYAVRAGKKVTVLYKDTGALARAEAIENYYGPSGPISGVQLAEQGMENARRLGVTFVQTEAVGVSWDGSFTVDTTAGSYTAPALLLATGAARRAPAIAGIKELEGKGVSYCATCDAFFYRNLPVAVVGAGEYALHEAAHLAPIASSVTLLTNGQPAPAELFNGLSVCTAPIAAIQGSEKVTGVQFADATPSLACAGVFVALGVAGSAEIARKLGAEISGSNIVTDQTGATAIPGLYAAGDCTGGLLQVAKAVHEGAEAGLAMVRYLRELG